LELLGGLVTEDGVTWAEQAALFQREDAAAICAAPDAGPRRHFLVRGRGMSKTTDVGAIGLGLLLSEAPTRSRSYVYAVDSDQALEVLDAITGFIARTAGLSGALDVAARSITVKATGASLTIESSDAASAWSKRPWAVIIDEFSSWPDTSNHRRLWTAIASSLPKRRDSRLIVLSMAGSPVHPSAKVWKVAQSSTDWRASSVPGPCPWWSEVDVESTRVLLTAAEYRRFVLGEWVETDSLLGSEADVMACVRSGDPVLPARDGVQYTAALDIGTRRDLTALVVAHMESQAAGRVTVVDRVVSWRPTAGLLGRVDLSEVEASTARICKEYRAKLRFDRSQGEQLTQNLARSGVRVEEYVFSQAGANRLAKSLFVALRDHALSIPDDAETISELMSTRLVETTPGMLKLSNPVGHHDDIPTAISMALVDLQDHLTGLPATFGGLVMARATVAGADVTGDVSALRRDNESSPWRGGSVATRSLLDDRTDAQRWAEVVGWRRGGR
jgi:hypothetical protein